ncbi:MAG: ABC transporter ATP-binding protein [Aggregatilineaceae bacterium]
MPFSLARPPVLRIQSVQKTYTSGCAQCAVLKDITLEVATGEFVVLLGASGSGKSTLLNLISGIDQPDHGRIIIDGTDITRLSETARTIFRRDHIGIVFQFFNLIPTLNVLENVTLPLELRGESRQHCEERARYLLRRVGLEDRAGDFPDKLSGGEQQRVAIARALIQQPELVLADEPTGNLDRENGRRVLALLTELTREAGRTLIMATHDPAIVPLANRVIRIQDGQLQEQAHSAEPALPLISTN